MKSSRQLANTATLCLQLRPLIKNGDDNNDKDGRSDREQQEQGSPEALKNCINNVESSEETQGCVDEEGNTFIFSSQDCDNSGNEQKVVDEYGEAFQHGSQIISNMIKDFNPDDQESDLQCTESHTSPVFKKPQPLKTYNRMAMRNSGMLRRTRQEVKDAVCNRSAEPRTMEAYVTNTKATSHKAKALIKGRKKLAWDRQLPMTYKASDESYLESDQERKVFKEMDVHVNVDGEANLSPDPPTKSVSSTEDSFGETFRSFFTKVKSRSLKAPNTQGTGTTAHDTLHGTPRTRAQKRRAPGTNLQNIFEGSARGNVHVQDLASLAKTKKLKSHQATLENFLNIPAMHSQIAVTRGHSRREGHSPRQQSQLPAGHRNKRGETLLHVAAIKGNLKVVRDMLRQGADCNAKDNAGWTPLHEACNHGHVAITELLLDSGAMLDMTGGFDHDTPLHDAVANGRLEIVKLLVTRGAPLNVRNKQGILPKDYAVGDAMLGAFSQSSKSHRQTSSPITLQPFSRKVSTTTHKVFLATGLSAVQKVQLQKCVDRLGGSCVVSDFSASETSIVVTHAVTATDGKGTCKRTIKYLRCVLTGKWIVRFQWISKCLRGKRWIDETPFEVAGTNEAQVEAPRRARQNALKQLPGLFDGCNFFFCGDFEPPHLSKDELIQMVKSGGGEILAREPKPDLDQSLYLPSRGTAVTTDPTTVVYHARPDSDQYRRTHYVIFDTLSERRSHMCKYSHLVCFAPVSWLMDCVSRFEIGDVPQC